MRGKGKSTASKHQKTPKSETLRNIKGPVLSPLLFPAFTNIYNDNAKCYPENMTMRYVDDATRFKTDDERFCHNKKKLERALNAKIICKEDDAEDQDDATMKKPEKLFNPPSGCIKCKDRTNYTRGMKIVFSAYVL